MKYEYVSLHNHSDASPDGAGTVTSLVQRAKDLKMGALGLTDHGTLANAVAFWSACDEQEIKPILGMEAYLLYEGKRHHITLLSMNERGFNNLVELDTWSHTKNYVSGYPLITLDTLYGRKEGIFALTGCISSALYQGKEDNGMKYVGDLIDTMSVYGVGLETMFIGSHDTWSRPISIHKRFDLRLPLVITNDSHYPCRRQFHAHQTITSARRGFTYDSRHLWLKSAGELVHEAIKYTDESVIAGGLDNTLRLAEMVEKWDMKAAPSLPSIPDVAPKISKYLLAALKEDVRLKGKQKIRVDRLKYEFHILNSQKFLDYIYILWDIVLWAKGAGIYVGPGRGSGGGSYVLYLLGITGIDPIEYGLVFERFINPSRSDYPDVDVDFESDRRHEVMEYAQRQWGTIPIATYSCYSHKSAIHDIARVLKIPKDLEVAAADSSVDSDSFRTFINDKEDALDTYNTMLGQIRHRGKHAAGVIIPNRPVPIERSGDELVAAWAEGMNTKDLSKVGIVKYDLLGLTALSQLKRMTELTGVHATAIGWTYTDPEVYDLFCKGDVAGIFQWSGSEGIKELTQRIAPRNFYDLATCNALYRPGALDAGTADQYPEFMKKPRKLHPRIDPHLEKTYGVICYQEQVMAVVAEVMGGDLSQADIARRLISKAAVGDPKWEREMEELRIHFYQKGRDNGFSEDLVLQLWWEVATHSGYSYNLAHATAYTMISYQMAWFKVNFRNAFTVAVLQYDKANAQTYILDAVKHGLEVRMPNVNHSTDKYETMHSTILDKDIIFLPLGDIAFLGDKALNFILEERNTNGKFLSYENFNARIPKKVCNNRARKMLERIGAFEDFLDDPSLAIKDYEDTPITSLYQTQLEILKYVIPSASLLAKIEVLARQPARKNYTRFAGFVSKATKKKSSHGEYTVFTLSPSGSFWCREPKKSIKVGTFVSGTKSHFGHSTDVKAYKLGGD